MLKERTGVGLERDTEGSKEEAEGTENMSQQEPRGGQGEQGSRSAVQEKGRDKRRAGTTWRNCHKHGHDGDCS